MEPTPLNKIETVDVRESVPMDDTKKGILISLGIVLLAGIGGAYFLTKQNSKDAEPSLYTLTPEQQQMLLSQIPQSNTPAVDSLSKKDQEILAKQIPTSNTPAVTTLSQADQTALLKQLK